MKRFIIFTLTVLFLVCSAANVMASSYADTFGASARGIGLGNAMTARVDDWSSVFYNMAGLGRTQHLPADADEKTHPSQMAISYVFNSPAFDVSPEPVNKPTNNLDTDTIVIGTVIDNNVFFKQPDFLSSSRFGLLFALNGDQTASKVNDWIPYMHNFIRYGDECQRIAIMAGIGFGFMDDKIGFGIGANSYFGGNGNVIIPDTSVSADPQTPAATTQMELTLNQALLFGVYARPLDRLTMGMSYRQENYLELDPFGTVANMPGFGLMPIMLSILDYYHPSTMTLGVAYELGTMTISLDIERQTWSEYEISALQELNFGDQLPDLEDIIIPKIGIEYQMSDKIDLLFGYYYQPTFISDAESAKYANYLDNDKHVGSIGMVYQLPVKEAAGGPMEVVVSYQYQHMVDRDIEKNDPVERTTSGGQTVIYPEYTYGGACHSIMMEFNIRL